MAEDKKIIATESFEYGLDQFDEVIEKIKIVMRQCTVFAFHGSLGAGKTTLIRKLLRSLGVTDVITSPTFTYMNRYKNRQGQTFYHFDLYRLSYLNEFIEAGFDEYLYQENSFAFIEWPEIVMPLFKKNGVCVIHIDHGNDSETRHIKIEIIKKAD